MKNIKQLSIAAAILSTMLIAGPASAYTMTIYNGTTEDIVVDVGGYAVAGSSMTQGKIKHIFGDKVHDIQVQDNNTTYDNAGAVPLNQFPGGKNKPLIKPGHVAILKFNDIDAGICFDWGNMRVGTASEGYALRARPVKFPDDETMDKLISSIKSLGSGIKDIGKGTAQLESPQAKAAGEIIAGAGSMWEHVTTAISLSGCGNRDIVVIKGNDGKIDLMAKKG